LQKVVEYFEIDEVSYQLPRPLQKMTQPTFRLDQTTLMISSTLVGTQKYT